MAKVFRSSLRSRAIILVLLAILPLSALAFYSYLDQRDRAIRELQSRELVVVKNFAAIQENVISDTRNLLMALAQLPQVQRHDRNACNALFAELLKESPYRATIGSTDAEGRLIASAPAVPDAINYTDRLWFQKVIQTRTLVLGENVVGRISGKYGHNLAYPILDAEGRLLGTLTTQLNLDWLENLLAKSDFPPTTAIVLTDSTHKVLFRYPEPQKYVGVMLPDFFIKAMDTIDEGVLAGVGLPGDERLFAFTRLAPPWQDLRVAIGLPKEWAIGPVNRVLWRNLFWLGLVTIFTMAAAWFGGDIFILRPVKKLCALSERLAAGDLRQRVGPDYPVGELGLLAHSFDQMADSLQQRDQELHRSKDELQLRVEERTAELKQTVNHLQSEVEERVQVEAMVKETEARFRSAFDRSPVGAVIADLNFRFQRVNPAFCRLSGYTAEELSCMAVTDIVHPDDLPKGFEEMRRFIAGEIDNVRLEERNIRKDGTIIWVDASVDMIVDSDGRPKYYITIVQDITGRKQAEEDLSRSEALLRTILETLPVGVWVCDQDGRITLGNPAAHQIWGGARYLGPSQYSQYKGWWPETGKRIESEEWALARALRRGESLLNEVVEIESFDGVRKFILVSAVPIRGPHQEITGAIAVHQDIAELKAAEAKIYRLNRLYSVLSKINEAIVRLRDPLHLYREACRILVDEGGFRMAWVGLRDPATQLVKPVAYGGIEEGYLETIAKTYQYTPEAASPLGVAIREGRYDICADFARDPRMIPWREEARKRGYRSSMAMPLRQGANVVGAVTIYADQPEFFKDEEIGLLEYLAADLSFALESIDLEKRRRQAAASLAKSEKKLRRLTSQLLSTQEHERSRVSRELHDELGQSLMVLKMQMRAIQRQLGKAEPECQNEIAESLNFITEVIENVRRLSRNLSPLILEGLGLNQALRNLFDDFAKHYEIKDFVLNLDVVDDVIPKESQINIYRIFQEALTNIGKYAHPSKVTVEIQRTARGTHFRIEDNGAGFDPEEVIGRKAQEKGMGMTTMSERVKIMGGTFHIKSKKGQGTNITFSLPLD